jgi:hypothetical protein
MPLYSPPIPISRKKQRLRNATRRLTWRRQKYAVKGPRKLRRAWKRNTTYYYIDPKKQRHRKIRAKQEPQIQRLLPQRLLDEFIYGKPTPMASRRRGPWSFFLERKEQEYHHNSKTASRRQLNRKGKARGMLWLLRFLAMECGLFVDAVVSDGSDKSVKVNFKTLSKLLKTLEQVMRRVPVARFLPWKRRSTKKMTISLEW